MGKDKNTEGRSSVGKKAGITGIVCNFMLALGKLIVGTIASSMSITADGLNNLSDAASSIVTLIGFKLAEKPADREHPYGHARFEYLASLTVAVMILVIGVELAKSSVKKILHPAPIEFSLVIALVLIASILVKLWMMIFYGRLGKKISSSTLDAVSEDSRNDVLTTGAVLIASITEHFTGFKIDGIMGILVSIFILYSGFGLAKKTLSPILGEGADSTLRKQLTDYIKSCPLVLGCHDLMVHDYGPGKRYASIHVEIDKNIDPLVCHEEIDKIERDCLANYGINLVVHYDPVITDDSEADAVRQTVKDILNSVDSRITIHDFRLLRESGEEKLDFDIAIPVELRDSEQDIKDCINKGLNGKYELNITFDMDTEC